jgi:mono/diheme cytochrome c family protein
VSVKKVAAIVLVGAASMGLTLVSAAVDPHAGHGAAAAKTATAAPAAAPATPQSTKTATPTSTTPPAGAAAAPAATSVAAVDPAKGRELFSNWSCGSCHALADAGGTGHVGPALDGNRNLSKSLVVDRVTNGQGQMPAFGGQMTDEEIAQISDYIVQYSAK